MVECHSCGLTTKIITKCDYVTCFYICLLYVLYSIKVIRYFSKGGYCSIRWFVTLFHSGATNQGGKFPYEDKLWPQHFEGLKHIIWTEKMYANIVSGLPQSGATFWKMKKKSDQGKVMEFYFQSGKFRKNEEKMEF